MKLFSRLFVLYCRNCPKDDKFEEDRGGVEPWLMARCRVLVSVIELLFLSLAVEALQALQTDRRHIANVNVSSRSLIKTRTHQEMR